MAESVAHSDFARLFGIWHKCQLIFYNLTISLNSFAEQVVQITIIDLDLIKYQNVSILNSTLYGYHLEFQIIY